MFSNYLYAVLIALPYVCIAILIFWYRRKLRNAGKAPFIVISKEEMTLWLYDSKCRAIFTFGIACGKNYGDKRKWRDYKTPEGIFHIVSIENSSEWTHDFGDGKGVIACAYGPYFLRLKTPGFKGIGIHGTHLPESIGTRATEGCIRLRNEDLEELASQCFVGMKVFIIPSSADLAQTL